MASLTDMLAQPREDQLILVDLLDRPQGSMGKLACHQQARLHRAFSLFLYRESGGTLRLLLQRRAQGKYHSGGLLANSVCSHPRVGEALAGAVPRRLTRATSVYTSAPPSGWWLHISDIAPARIFVAPSRPALRLRVASRSFIWARNASIPASRSSLRRRQPRARVMCGEKR